MQVDILAKVPMIPTGKECRVKVLGQEVVCRFYFHNKCVLFNKRLSEWNYRKLKECQKSVDMEGVCQKAKR